MTIEVDMIFVVLKATLTGLPSATVDRILVALKVTVDRNVNGSTDNRILGALKETVDRNVNSHC